MPRDKRTYTIELQSDWIIELQIIHFVNCVSTVIAAQ